MTRLGSMVGPRLRGLSTTRAWALVIPSGIVLLAWFGGLASGIDARLFDGALRWRAFRQPVDQQPYVLVEIDDRSITELGRFPWDRSRFAELLARTREGRARVVGLDVLFAEPDDSGGDSALAEALRAAGNVVLSSAPVISDTAGGSAEGPLARLPAASTIIRPIPDLRDAAAGVGSISIREGPDGSLRRYSLVLRHDGAPYPSLAQLVAGIAAGDSARAVSIEGDGTMLINWGSLSPRAIQRISFSRALELGPREALELFRDRIVLVGATYTGGVDYGPSPLAPRTPRVFAQIYAVHTLLAGERLRELPPIAGLFLAIVAVGLLGTQIPARHPLQLLEMGGALAGVLLIGSAVAFLAGNVILGPTLPVLAVGLVVSGYGIEQWWTTNTHLRRRNAELQETLENLRRTRSAKERMEAELNVAREIQFSMLPLDFPERREFELHARLVPAREVGGDFYDFFFVDDEHLCLCVADVSDKGVPAALFMAVSKAILKSVAGQLPSPGALLTRANAELARDNEASMFVTAWLGILDLRSGRLAFTNAGHNPPYVTRSDGGLTRVGSLHGPPLAVLEGIEYGEDELLLQTGDSILLYTDGVPEAMSPEGALYGEARLEGVLGSTTSASTRELVEAAADDVWRFQGSAVQADDLTLLALRYRGLAQSEEAPGGNPG